MISTVACVLRSGGSFGPGYVERLAAGVRRHAPPGTRFLALTDVDVAGVECVPLHHDWPGWWAKMEAYGRLREAMLLDLDSVIVGDLSDLLAFDGPCAILRDHNLVEHREVPGRTAIGSAVVIWRDFGMRGVFDAFASDPAAAIGRWTKRSDHFIVQHLPADVQYVQDLWPDQVQCAKRGFSRGFRDPSEMTAARIITTWKEPRLHELPVDHWLRRKWEDA